MKFWKRIVFVILSAAALMRAAAAQVPEKDYLSNIEADKIRDAEPPNE